MLSHATFWNAAVLRNADLFCLHYSTGHTESGGGKRRGLGPRNDVLTTCKAVNPRASQRPSKAAVCFLTISTLALSFE